MDVGWRLGGGWVEVGLVGLGWVWLGGAGSLSCAVLDWIGLGWLWVEAVWLSYMLRRT